MKKKLIWALEIVLVAVAAYIFLAKRGTCNSNNNNIALINAQEINRFIIEDTTSKIIIEKKGDKWISNNTYKSDNKIITQLFRLFKNIEISALPPKDSVEFYKKELQKKANTISFFNNDKLLTRYWVAKYDVSKKATLLMNDTGNPVYAKALGLSSDIAQYVITDELLWRNKQIFAFETNKIKSLKFKNYKNNSLSFQILKGENNLYSVKNNNQEVIKTNQENIKRYLSYFSNIEFKTICKTLSPNQIDSLKKQNTIYSIDFNIDDYGNFNINLIAKPSTDNSQETDMNNVYGLVNNKLPLLNISYFDIDPVIKEISYFKSY